MDPITISSLLAAAAGALGSEAVKDVYDAAKKRIQDLFGEDEELLEAMEDLEAKPQSSLKKKTVQGQIEKYDKAQIQELLEPLTNLQSLLIDKGLFVTTGYSATQSGAGGLAQGPGSTAAGTGGVAVGGDVHGSINVNAPAPDPI